MADVATLVFDIDSSSARTAATDLAKVNDAAVRASRGADNLNRTLRDSSGRFRSSVSVVGQYGSEVQQLAAKYNPALNAVYKFQQRQLELNRAVMLGVLTQKQADAALDQYSMSLRAAAVSSVRLGNAQKQTGYHTANVFSQLNDIGVMMAAGQNPIQLALQQGTQLNQVWASMGKEGKSLVGVAGILRGAISSMISPMSLLTLGVIAGAAALTQWAFSSSGATEKAKTLSEQVDSMASSVGAYTSSLEASRRTTLDLVKDYGLLAGFAKEALANIASVEQAKALREIEQTIKSTVDSIIRTVDVAGIATPTLIKDLGLSGQAANDVANGLYKLQFIQGNIERAAAAGKLSKEMLAAYGSVEKMPPEMQEVYNALNRTVTETSKASAATSEWAGRMSSVLSYINAIQSSMANISGGAIRLAAIRTETELLRQGRGQREASLAAARQTAELEGAAKTKELEKQYGWAGKILGIAQQNQALAIINAENMLDLEREAARERERASAGGGGGGAAARELAAAQKGFQSLRQLLEQETMFQVAEWEKRQAQLDMALAKKLLSEQNYQEMRKQLQMMYFGSEFEVNAVNYALDLEQLEMANNAKLLSEEQYLMKRQQLQWDYMAQADSTNANLLSQELSNWGAHFGDMNRLAGGGYDSLIRMQKSFAAASALINTWLGYTKALAEGPPMTPWMRLAWAGKILAAGMGAVNAIKGGGKGSSASTATAAAKAEPQRNVLVRLEGDEWLTGMAEQIMTEIYEQTGNGRVVVQRDYI